LSAGRGGHGLSLAYAFLVGGFMLGLYLARFSGPDAILGPVAVASLFSAVAGLLVGRWVWGPGSRRFLAAHGLAVGVLAVVGAVLLRPGLAGSVNVLVAAALLALQAVYHATIGGLVWLRSGFRRGRVVILALLVYLVLPLVLALPDLGRESWGDIDSLRVGVRVWLVSYPAFVYDPGLEEPYATLSLAIPLAWMLAVAGVFLYLAGKRRVGVPGGSAVWVSRAFLVGLLAASLASPLVYVDAYGKSWNAYAGPEGGVAGPDDGDLVLVEAFIAEREDVESSFTINVEASPWAALTPPQAYWEGADCRGYLVEAGWWDGVLAWADGVPHVAVDRFVIVADGGALLGLLPEDVKAVGCGETIFLGDGWERAEIAVVVVAPSDSIISWPYETLGDPADYLREAATGSRPLTSGEWVDVVIMLEEMSPTVGVWARPDYWPVPGVLALAVGLSSVILLRAAGRLEGDEEGDG